jgi:protein DEK
MFRTPGKATVIKKNIRAFSGFPEGFDSAKTEDLFNRAFAATLNAVLDLFDLPRGVGEEGKKESKVARIMAFMAAPKASGKKDMKAAADAKREKAAEKRERLAAKKTKLAEKKDKAKAKKEREQAKKDKERAKKGGGKGAKALPTDAEAIKAELQAMAARQAKLLAKLEKAVEEPASAKSGRAAAPRGDAEAPPAKRAKATAAEGSAPDAATAEKQSKMPADDALREAIAELLKDGDQESLSLKKMRADLEARFGVPLNEKKAKIKEIVEAIVE